MRNTPFPGIKRSDETENTEWSDTVYHPRVDLYKHLTSLYLIGRITTHLSLMKPYLTHRGFFYYNFKFGGHRVLHWINHYPINVYIVSILLQ